MEFERARGFVNVLLEAGCRVAVLPGNHDRYTFRAHRERRFERFFGDLSNQGVWPYLARITDHAAILFLDQTKPNIFSAKGLIGDAQLSACARLLEKACRDAEFVIVTGHYPLLGSTETYSLREGRRLGGAKALRELLGKASKTVLYVAGHVHVLSYTQDSEYPNLSHLTTAATFRISGGGRKASLEFSRIAIARKGLVVERHYRKDGEWKIRKITV
jgi:hypothetical protein